MFDFSLYTQVSDSGPHGPLVLHFILCFTVSVYTYPLHYCPRSLNNWIILVIMHFRPTNTFVSMISGVILRSQNVLNEISSLVNNIKSSAGDKNFRSFYKHCRHCPVAWSFEVQLAGFFCSSILVVLFNTLGFSKCHNTFLLSPHL